VHEVLVVLTTVCTASYSDGQKSPQSYCDYLSIDDTAYISNITLPPLRIGQPYKDVT
jgi:hypothetical protein